MIDVWVERVAGGQTVAHDWANERIASLGRVARDASTHSLSHHRDWLALAVSTGEPVGVDALTVPEHADFVSDTALVLSADEIAWVRSEPRVRQGAAFAECWVRNEAYAKMRGTGLTAELAGLTLSPDPSAGVDVGFWTARIEDAMVAVATTGSRESAVRLHHRDDSLAIGLPLRCSNHQ
jgi:hypothetical protein